LARDLYKGNWRQNFQETNASDERGINIVRTRIKEFARIKPIDAPFKIVFLDESDALTSDAQQALRRTIEQYSSSCRFILSCNYSSKIITPIQSRCSVFRFKPLEKKDVEKYLETIIKEEKLKVDKSAHDAIFDLSNGDMRRAVNLLQASSSLGGKITGNVVYEVASQAKPQDIKTMLDFVVNGDFKSARKKLHELILKQGLAGEDIISACHREVYNLEIPDDKKVEFVSKIGEYDFRISEGGDPIIQLESMLAQFMLSSKK
jgi:replication factor C small subunit